MATAPRSRGVGYPGVTCPHCQYPLVHASLRSGPQSCPRCGGTFEGVRFDPPEPDTRTVALGEAGPAGASACASHRNNAAITNCGRCGVFMCGLCRIESDGLVLCPGCFDRLSSEGALPSARIGYRDYGRMAASLAVLGLVLWFVGIVAGPAAVFYGIKGLRQKRELGEDEGRAGIWAAMILGGLEAAGWTAFFVFLSRGA